MARKLLVCLTLLGALALVTPALASGPSAGDQQYIDPLANSHHGSSHSQTSPTSTAPAPAGPAPSAAAPAGTTSTTGAPSSAATTSATADPSQKSLPMTGFSAGLAALIGACLVASGAFLWRIEHSG
jgi:LPXTG-motif cell wall-anchored protein